MYSRWVLPEKIRPVKISINLGVLKLGNIHYGRFKKLNIGLSVAEDAGKHTFFSDDCIQNINLNTLTVKYLKGLGEYLDSYCTGISDLIEDSPVNLKVEEFKKS